MEKAVCMEYSMYMPESTRINQISNNYRTELALTHS